MSQRIWTEEVLQNVYRLLRDGYGYGEIAEMYGVTRVAVRNRANQTWVGAKLRALTGATRVKAPRFWTTDRLAEVRKLYWHGRSTKQIAAALGASETAVNKVISDLGIADRKEAARKVAAKRIGTRHTPEAIAKMRDKARARWDRPDYVARHRAAHSAEVMRLRGRQGNDARRGFAIPDHLQDDYRNLTKRKGYSAREAAIALRIIPSDPAQKEA